MVFCRSDQGTYISLKLEIFYYKNIKKIELFGYFRILDPLFNSKFNEICVKGTMLMFYFKVNGLEFMDAATLHPQDLN